MKLRDVVNILNAEVITGEDSLDIEIKTACGADLMSDVLAFVKGGSLLLTGLTNPQVIQTANILDIPAIVLVRNKKPSAEMIALANEFKIPLLTTKYVLFESAGRLYANGMLPQPAVENTGKKR
ncbi:MAG TPA: DRTGG domain-containing protein [Smithella sp.]|nr:DRTGG domain-containing protein [Smithella sp.]